MPNSLFGSPTSHLLTQVVSSSPPTASGNGVGSGTPTPVCHPPPSFADVHFGTIGKPPTLLSRISEPDPVVRSLSPLILPPSPEAPHGHVPNSRTLVERIQMSPAQSNSSKQSLGVELARSGTNRHRYVSPSAPAVPSDNLIPPIEILSTTSESNLPSSDTQPFLPQQAQSLGNGLTSPNIAREISLPDLLYPATVPSIKQSNLDSPLSNASVSSTISPTALPQHPVQSSVSSMTAAPLLNHPVTAGARLSSSQGLDVTAAEAPQNSAAQDNMSAIHAQLRAKCDTFASLAPPTLCPRSPSPFGVPRNISELVAGLRKEMDTEEPNAIVLHQPYTQNKSASNSISHQESVSSNNNALAPASSQTPSQPASHCTHLLSLVEAMKKLQTAAGAAFQVQLDADQALASERMEFDERRKMFEERMLAREAEYQSKMQAMQKQLEVIRAREQRLVAMEEDARLRDETRRARDAHRRAQDDQRKIEDESRRKAIHEEIADAMQLLEQAKAEKQRWQEERARSERDMTMGQVNGLPLRVLADIGPRIKKEEGMTEEEINTVDKYDQCLARVGYLSEKLQSLVACTRQLFDTLQRMKEARLQVTEEKRQRFADEVESRRIQAEVTRQGAHAETVRQKVQAEAERRIVQLEETARRNKEQGRDHLLDNQGPQQPLSVGEEHLSQVDPTQMPIHPERQKSHGPPDAEVGSARLRAQLVANKQEITIASENATHIHAERAGLAALPATHGDSTDDTNLDMEIDELESSPVGYTVSLPGRKGMPRRKPVSKKMMTAHSRGTSGKVMLGTASTASSRLPDSCIPSTLSTATRSDAPVWYKTPSFVSASTEIGRRVITDAPLYPTEFASESDMPTSLLSNDPVSTSRNTSLPTTPTSHTILANQTNEITVGPLTDPSPAHQDANLRHIKKNRCRLQSNSEDGHVKQHDNDLPMKKIKTEEGVDMTTPKGLSTPPMDVTDPVQHDDPPSTPSQAVLNPSNSQQNDPQTSTKLISQVPDVSSRNDIRGGDPSQPISRLSASPLSPDPLVMETSAERRSWNAVPVLPRSGPSESAYHHGPEDDSRMNHQTSVRTTSPESFTRGQRRSYDSYNVGHYSPPPVPPISSRPRLPERNEPGASRPLARPRLKRPAECDIEDDSRDRRRRRGDHYEPERDRDFRHIRGPRERQSPITEWRGTRSNSPDGKLYSPQPLSLEHRIECGRTVHERRSIRNGSYSLDNTDVANAFQGLSDAEYNIEDYATPDEPQGGIALLQRMSSGPVGTMPRARTKGSNNL